MTTVVTHSPDYLQLNGLHVILFSSIEHFLRGRVIEILQSLGKSGVKFDFFPTALKLYLLQESFKGTNFQISKKAASEKIDNFLIEILSLNTHAVDNLEFVPSSYCFGNSQSNISYTQISSLLEAFGVMNPPQVMLEIQSRLQQQHLGSIDLIFSRLAENRHSAAHSFSLDFESTQFLSDVKGAARILSFCIDTAISHAAHQIRGAFIAGSDIPVFSVDALSFRIFRFDSINQEFKVTRETPQAAHELPPVKEKRIEAEFKRLLTHKPDDTAVAIGRDGSIFNWAQPI